MKDNTSNAADNLVSTRHRKNQRHLSLLFLWAWTFLITHNHSLIQASIICLLKRTNCRQRKPKLLAIFIQLFSQKNMYFRAMLKASRFWPGPGGADVRIRDRYYGSRMPPLQFTQSKQVQTAARLNVSMNHFHSHIYSISVCLTLTLEILDYILIYALLTVAFSKYFFWIVFDLWKYKFSIKWIILKGNSLETCVKERQTSIQHKHWTRGKILSPKYQLLRSVGSGRLLSC